MADEARLEQLCSQLNEMLGDVSPYKLCVVDPKQVKQIDKNAHYMSKQMFDQLVANVKKDGNLSSLPLLWQHKDGRYEALSGNHRVKAAAVAGIPKILALYTDADLTLSQKRAIQLSHNAIFGQDNPQTLKELWMEIQSLEEKVYSGLDDEKLQTMQPVQIQRLDEADLRMEEVRLLFVAPEAERLTKLVKKIGGPGRRRFAANVADFDRFFDMLLRFKEATGIINSSTAILLMLEVVEEWLAKHDEQQAVEQKSETVKSAPVSEGEVVTA